MPRIEFTSKDEIKKWVSARMDPAKYECYLTASKEVILVPMVSTRPIMYVYFQSYSGDDLQEVRDLITSRGVHVYVVSNFEWRDDDRIR